MKHLTTDPVLRETFAYLEQVLGENNKQPAKKSNKSTTAAAEKCAIKNKRREGV